MARQYIRDIRGRFDDVPGGSKRTPGNSTPFRATGKSADGTPRYRNGRPIPPEKQAAVAKIRGDIAADGVFEIKVEGQPTRYQNEKGGRPGGFATREEAAASTGATGSTVKPGAAWPKLPSLGSPEQQEARAKARETRGATPMGGDRVANAEKMYGTGSVQHRKAQAEAGFKNTPDGAPPARVRMGRLSKAEQDKIRSGEASADPAERKRERARARREKAKASGATNAPTQSTLKTSMGGDLAANARVMFGDAGAKAMADKAAARAEAKRARARARRAAAKG